MLNSCLGKGREPSGLYLGMKGLVSLVFGLFLASFSEIKLVDSASYTGGKIKKWQST